MISLTKLAALFAVQVCFVAVYLQLKSPTAVDATREITYKGTRSSNIEHFQNIFYAEAPTGPRRFAPPVPTRPQRDSVIDATKAGAWCPQGTGDVLPFTSRVTNISEDCLSLRIARPRGTKSDAKLPVMAWLHGGMVLAGGQAIEEHTDNQKVAIFWARLLRSCTSQTAW